MNLLRLTRLLYLRNRRQAKRRAAIRFARRLARSTLIPWSHAKTEQDDRLWTKRIF